MHYEKELNKYSDKLEGYIFIVIISLSTIIAGSMGILFSEKTHNVWNAVWYNHESILIVISSFSIILFTHKLKFRNGIVTYVGSNTLSIYVIHMIIIELMKPYFLNLEIMKTFTGIAVFSLFVIVTCLLISYIIKRIPVLNKVLMLG